MPIIPATIHGIIDYLAGIGLLLVPWVLGLPSSTATMVLQVVGAATIASSLITDYRLSIAKLLPYRVHLLLDVAMGLAMLLTASLTSENGPGRSC